MIEHVRTRLSGLLRSSLEPVDVASLAAFRALFGLLMFASVTRFALNGWIDIQYVRPQFFFKYWGFEWVPVPPAPWIHVEFAALAVCALGIMLGLFYRWAVVGFLLGFTHVQLMDVTNYLNHYYLVVLVLLLLSLLPAHAALSMDAWRTPSIRRATVPAWMPWILRFQVGIVYVFAAIAKIGPDWLLHGQPLGLWLRSRADLPVLGALFVLPETAIVMSWAGFLFDATVVGFLLSRRTRSFAYAVILVFHGLTFALFNIGLFPFIMPVATTIFFAYDWPRRLFPRAFVENVVVNASWRERSWMPKAALVWCAFHLAMPLRTFAYDSQVLWAEEGMRFSWRVMVREKSGAVTYRVKSVRTGREFEVDPSRWLTPRQAREMSTQPDLIWQFAQHVARELEPEFGPVEVRAETSVSLNGRPGSPIVDPSVDLTKVSDGLAPKDWILAPTESSPALGGLVAAHREAR